MDMISAISMSIAATSGLTVAPASVQRLVGAIRFVKRRMSPLAILEDEMQRFEVLDSFRGLCAMAVVAFHMRILGSFTELAFFRSSFLFVEFFFALSGFVLAHSYGSQREFDARNFVISRTLRLFPLHLVMLACFLMLEYGKYFTEVAGIYLNNPAFTGANATREILPNLLLLQSWASVWNPHSFNSPSWSISVEFYIYLVFGAILLLAFRQKTPVWLVISAAGFLSLSSGSYLPTQYAARGLACFFAGAVTYRCFIYLRKRVDLRVSIATLLECACFGAVYLLLQSDGTRDASFAGILFCIAILVFSFGAGKVSHLMTAAPFCYLGRLSYSIYMTHAAVLFLLTSVTILGSKLSGEDFSPVLDGVRYVDSGSLILNNVIGLSVLGVVILVSRLTYHFIEKPGQRLARALAARKLQPRLGT